MHKIFQITGFGHVRAYVDERWCIVSLRRCIRHSNKKARMYNYGFRQPVRTALTPKANVRASMESYYDIR